jgi:uncharacterized protein (TIGR02391 family)
MARNRRPPDKPSIEIKQFQTTEELDRAIEKLKKRIEEVEALNPQKVQHNDQRVRNIEQKISGTILEIFGSNSPEYHRHGHHWIKYGPLYVGISELELQRQFAEGIPRTVTMLNGLIEILEEKRADFGLDATKRIRAGFEGLDLHPRIADVCAGLFLDGHYRNAVLDACLALVNFVKERSRRHDLDGADLMRTVFSKKNPILAFNDLKDQSDLDEQEGVMHLFEGAVLALRNPRAHTLSDDSPEEALEYIALLSLLAKKLETTKRRVP